MFRRDDNKKKKAGNVKVNQLRPTQVYYSMMGILLKAGYEKTYTVKFSLEDITKFNINASIEEIASVFVKGDQRYILYFPGTDHYDFSSFLLSTVIAIANPKLKRQLDNEFDFIPKLFCIAENGKKLLIPIKHFVFAMHDPQKKKLTIEDSKNEIFAVKVDADAIFPEEVAKGQIERIYRSWQSPMQDWQCGHYVIQAMMREITKTEAPQELIINENIIDIHKAYYDYSTEEKTVIDTTKEEESIEFNSDEPEGNESERKMINQKLLEVDIGRVKSTYELMNAAYEQLGVFLGYYKTLSCYQTELGRNKELVLALRADIEEQLKILNTNDEERNYPAEQMLLSKLLKSYNSSPGASPSSGVIGMKLKGGKVSNYKIFMLNLTKALFADYLPEDCKIETMRELAKIINKALEQKIKDTSKYSL